MLVALLLNTWYVRQIREAKVCYIFKNNTNELTYEV